MGGEGRMVGQGGEGDEFKDRFMVSCPVHRNAFTHIHSSHRYFNTVSPLVIEADGGGGERERERGGREREG